MRLLKEVTPSPAKSVVLSAVRSYGVLTSALRGLPDFLLIGAKRCGSTSLYRYLCGHPEILPLFPASAHIKGIHYFDRNYGRSAAWYRSHFRVDVPLRSPRVRGEASPYYLIHPLAAERAAGFVPDAKVIALLREPASRAFSHYSDEVKNGRERLTFSGALAAEETRPRPEFNRMATDPHYYSFVHEHLSYRTWGHYADHLERWLAVYPREQLLVLRSEDLFANPRWAIRQVTDFLGVAPYGKARLDRYNAAPPLQQDAEAIRALRAHYRPHNERLRKLLGWPVTWESDDPDSAAGVVHSHLGSEERDGTR